MGSTARGARFGRRARRPRCGEASSPARRSACASAGSRRLPPGSPRAAGRDRNAVRMTTGSSGRACRMRRVTSMPLASGRRRRPAQVGPTAEIVESMLPWLARYHAESGSAWAAGETFEKIRWSSTMNTRRHLASTMARVSPPPSVRRQRTGDALPSIPRSGVTDGVFRGHDFADLDGRQARRGGTGDSIVGEPRGVHEAGPPGASGTISRRGFCVTGRCCAAAGWRRWRQRVPRAPGENAPAPGHQVRPSTCALSALPAAAAGTTRPQSGGDRRRRAARAARWCDCRRVPGCQARFTSAAARDPRPCPGSVSSPADDDVRARESFAVPHRVGQERSTSPTRSAARPRADQDHRWRHHRDEPPRRLRLSRSRSSALPVRHVRGVTILHSPNFCVGLGGCDDI